jgi:hypothetical protein
VLFEHGQFGFDVDRPHRPGELGREFLADEWNLLELCGRGGENRPGRAEVGQAGGRQARTQPRHECQGQVVAEVVGRARTGGHVEPG